MAIVRVVKPDTVDRNDNASFMFETYAAVTQLRQFREDKGQPTDRYEVDWDDAISAVPDESTILTDYTAWQAVQTANQDKRDSARDNKGQGTSVPDLVARLDNLIEVLQLEGVIPE